MSRAFVLSLSLLAVACARQSQPSKTTTTSSDVPGSTVPGSPADVWTTTGGPASPGVPAAGGIHDDHEARDAGVQPAPPRR